MSLVRELEKVVLKAKMGDLPDGQLASLLLSSMEKAGLTSTTFVMSLIENLRQEANKKEEAYRIALDFAMNPLVGIMREAEGTKQLRRYVQEVVTSPGRLAALINSVKVWIPHPENGGFCTHSTWLLNKMVDTIDFPKYVPGGSSHDWAVLYGHYDYLMRLKAIKDERQH